MLRFLRIKHLAVIDSVELEFDPGLNVLTGETGAGKSILVGAVSLLLGSRASGDLVRTGEQVATIEAIFESADGVERLVRREITSQGRSRAFVDGELTTAGALKELAGQLVELHGQHEHQTLLDSATHLAVLDGFGGLDTLVAPTRSAFERLQAAAGARQQLQTAATDRASRHELAAFQLGELEKAMLKSAAPGQPAEDEELAATRQVLANAERVERLCAESYAGLYDNEAAVLPGLGAVWKRVGELAALDAKFLPFLEARDGIKSQLEDLARFLRRYADALDVSPDRLQQVEERLALLERVKRKYGPTLADAIARRDALRRELVDLDTGEERLQSLTREHEEARTSYLQAANVLGRARRQIATEFARRVEQQLGELAMERTRFEVRFAADRLAEPAWAPAGIDEAEFYVSPNPGEDLRPLARIVSGGELSRIMLAIKTLSAASRHGFTETGDRPPSGAAPGLIFDEVDAGIGGRVADVVGRKLRMLGSAFQVLCITHLPQVAAYADTHFQIEKQVDTGRTRTVVTRLDANGRVEELSRMLGGTDISAGLRASAREMLEERQASAKAKAKGESESGSPRGRTGNKGRRGAEA